jgi:hypothetical protein
MGNSKLNKQAQLLDTFTNYCRTDKNREPIARSYHPSGFCDKLFLPPEAVCFV